MPFTKRKKRKADEIRKMELNHMENWETPPSAVHAFQRPAYQTISVAQYLKKRSDASG